MDVTDVKRKLRECKRLERKMRYGDTPAEKPSFVWDTFFDVKEVGESSAKYTLTQLAGMSHSEYKRVIEDYWAFVYRELLREDSRQTGIRYDTSLLIQLDLPFDADEKAVKKNFGNWPSAVIRIPAAMRINSLP